jgi:hypothetical protein
MTLTIMKSAVWGDVLEEGLLLPPIIPANPIAGAISN